MASLDNHKANGARLSRLLIDIGTQAIRKFFDRIHHPSNLTAVLKSNKPFLERLRWINLSQQEILFPSSGTPQTSKDFDITLLFILLRNICGLHPPVATGSWDKNPPTNDTSKEANLVRIKYYRNAVYGHITTTGIDDVNFLSYWNSISTALIALGISHGVIESIRFTPLEEDVYLNLIREWKEKEDKLEYLILQFGRGLNERLDQVDQGLKEVKDAVLPANIVIQSNQTIIDGLAKCNVKGDIVKHCKEFHEGSRKWLLDNVENWFTKPGSDSRVMILTAGPGVGKSVFAAKVCQMYQEKGLLAACHFCKFNYSDRRNPKTMLESLSSHMCDNVPGFKEKLAEQLHRRHSKVTIRDAFRVLLNDPLHALDKREPMMIVIDGLDESETNGKSELLDLMAKDFPDLPECVKIFITSRPELPVREKLAYLNPAEIKPGDENNEQDLKDFLGKRLSAIKLEEDAVEGLVEKCQGSFLFAYHIVLSLTQQLKNESSMVVDVESCVPKSIGSVYQEYFDRLKKELAQLFEGKTEKFDVILEILCAAEGPLPLSLVAEVLELPADNPKMKKVIRKVNERLSALLLVFDDCLTVFHKSVVDWLLSEGYDDHPYTVDETSGDRHLWLVCRKKLETVKEIRHTKRSKRQARANEYAEEYGIEHLRFLTSGRRSSDIDFRSDETTDCTCEISARQEGPRLGCGWRFFQDHENEYVMTTKNVVNAIQSKSIESEPTVHMKFLSDSCEIRDIVVRYGVVVCSDEGSLLNYAVIKYSGISSNGTRPLTIGKLCLPPTGTLVNVRRGDDVVSGPVISYPSDMIEFLKKTTRFRAITLDDDSIRSATILHVDKIERNKEIFLFNDAIVNYAYGGSPIYNSDQNVFGMLNFPIYIKSGSIGKKSTYRRRYICNAIVRIDKIVEDIYRKMPELAQKIFPDFRDMC